jgi:hypothetical protein
LLNGEYVHNVIALKQKEVLLYSLQKRKNLKTSKAHSDRTSQNIALTENIKISDVLQLKEMLNEWIKNTHRDKNLE